MAGAVKKIFLLLWNGSYRGGVFDYFMPANERGAYFSLYTYIAFVYAAPCLKQVVKISPIEKVTINDGETVLKGYLDIGLYDTMEDLFVTFVGAVSFNLFAAVYSRKHKDFIFCLLKKIGGTVP